MHFMILSSTLIESRLRCTYANSGDARVMCGLDKVLQAQTVLRKTSCFVFSTRNCCSSDVTQWYHQSPSVCFVQRRQHVCREMKRGSDASMNRNRGGGFSRTRI